MNCEKFQVRIPEDENIRIDAYVASLGMFSRSQIGKHCVQVYSHNGVELKMSHRLKNNDEITVMWDAPKSSNIEAERIDLNIIYEDENCIVINKEQGIVIHPAPGHSHGTLVQGLLYRYASFLEDFEGDRIRPGIVHRLDKDTSGVMIAGKSLEAVNFLTGEFRARRVKKQYLAISTGIPAQISGEINHSIGRDPQNRKRYSIGTKNAKNALTRYQILSKSGKYALIRLEILTGRTHQIRVHLNSIGASVLGDPIYGRCDRDFPDATLMLHSWKLHICLPNGEIQQFVAEIPRRFLFFAGKLGLRLP